MKTWNKSGTAWFSAENYRVIKKAQVYDHSKFLERAEAMCDAILEKDANSDNSTLPSLIENSFIVCNDHKLLPNFLTFDSAVYQELCTILAPLTERVANCMIEISDKAEEILTQHTPLSVREQCKDVAKIHHRLDVAAFLLEKLIADQKLTVPTEKTPLCVFGVKK